MRFGKYEESLVISFLASRDPFLNEDLVRSATGPRIILEDREDPVNTKMSEETLEYVSSLKSNLKQEFEEAS